MAVDDALRDGNYGPATVKAMRVFEIAQAIIARYPSFDLISARGIAQAILPIVARVEQEAYRRGQAEHGPRASAPAASTETPDLGAWPTIPTERRTEVSENTQTVTPENADDIERGAQS